MTVNKSQGQTLGIVGLDLHSSAFSHDQLYVAMSRATDVANHKPHLFHLLCNSLHTTTRAIASGSISYTYYQIITTQSGRH